MFDPGTKIILLDSSHQKTIGPRKGSIGYVSNCSDTRVFNLIGDDFEPFNIVSTFCEVFFIRYGFEEKNRLEKKHIISIIPVLKRNNNNELNVAKIIKNFRNQINSSQLWNSLRECYNASVSVPIVLATPLSCDRTDLLTCNELEFKAWTNSHANNVKMERFINGTLLSTHFNKYKDPEFNYMGIWEDLRYITIDKTYRANYIKTWMDNIDGRKDCISIIRKLISTQSKINIRKIIEINKEVQIVGMYEFPTIIYGTIVPFLYNKAIFNSFINMCYGWEVDEITLVIKDIESLVSECLLLSNSMI
jgi:hypothetical protein